MTVPRGQSHPRRTRPQLFPMLWLQGLTPLLRDQLFLKSHSPATHPEPSVAWRKPFSRMPPQSAAQMSPSPVFSPSARPWKKFFEHQELDWWGRVAG